MKKIKGIIISAFVIIIIVIVVIVIIFKSKSQASSEEDLNYKVEAELQYLDNKLLSMLNGLNNIKLRNYIVTSTEVGQSSETTDNESSGVTKNSDETEVDSDSENKNNETKTNIQELKAVGVLTSNKEPDWETLKSEIEILYSSWTTVILDLYKLNINSEDILEFSKTLDTAIIYIKEENKNNSLIALSNLYKCLPKYLEGYSSDMKKINLQKTKSNLINAYVLVETDNWNEINTQIANAELNYLDLLNSVSMEQNYEINKGYILLKELQNSLSEKDKDIFYIKYKNLLEKLNNIC